MDCRLQRQPSVPSAEPYAIHVQPAKRHFGITDDAYKNNTNPRGLVFIGNFSKFYGKKPKDERHGSTKDVSQLQELFTQMGYKVMGEINDGTKQQTIEALESFRDLNAHAAVDSMILILMSHGKGNEFYTSDGESIHYDEVCNMFNDENCPLLRNKPKLILFQFCRKNKKNRNDCERRSQSRANLSAIICFSTSNGNVSYRYNELGTLFFYHACKIFMNHAKDTNYDQLFKKIARNLPAKQRAEKRELGMDYTFYFNPPFENELMLESRLTHSVSSEETDSTLLWPSCSIATDSASDSESDDLYKMSASPGWVLAMNNLSGCEKDMQRLYEMFSKLGFRVMGSTAGITYEGLMVQIEKFQQESHREAAIFIFYGQGSDEYLVTSDGICVRHIDLMTLFNDKNCPQLSGKPKLFIFNVCSTNKSTYPSRNQSKNATVPKTVHHNDQPGPSSGMASSISAHVPRTEEEDEEDSDDENEEEEEDSDDENDEIAEKDMMLLNVVVESGNCDDGSLLTDALSNVLLDPKHINKELEPLLRHVMVELKVLSEKKGEKYFSMKSSHRFQKEFYFKLQDDQKPERGDDETECRPIQRPRASSTSTNSPVKKIGKNKHELMKVIHGNDNIYDNTSSPRGKAIHIVFSNYESNQFPTCDWHKEEAKMTELVDNFGYNPTVYESFTYDELMSELIELKNEPELMNHDSLVITVFGFTPDLNHFYDKRGRYVPICDILSHFTDEQCPAMKRKPKIIFLHMLSLGKLQDKILLPKHWDLKDTFVLYLISHLDEKENSHPMDGLLMLYNSIKLNASRMDFTSIIMEVQEELMTKSKYEKIVVKPINVCKDLYLNPNPPSRKGKSICHR